MEIKDLLSKDLMIMNLKSTTKKDVIDEMIEKLYENNVINDVLKFRSEIMKRVGIFDRTWRRGCYASRKNICSQ